MQKTNYIGVDLSKLEVVADLAAEATPRAFVQSAEGLAAFLKALPTQAHVVCESSGGYQRDLVAACQAAGVPVSVVVPARVRAFAKAQGLRAKTDPIDARLLSAFGQAMQPRSERPSTAAQQQLQELLRTRQILSALLTEEASYAEHTRLPWLKELAAERKALLKKQISDIEKRLRQLLAQDATWQWRAQRVQEVCGVGEVTAWTVLAEMPELGTLRPGQPAALLGVAPDPDDSGPRNGRRHISGGRSHVRKVFYMAAVSAAHRNPILAAFYQRLVLKRHKPTRLALTAVMRKLIELLNHLLADPNFKLAT